MTNREMLSGIFVPLVTPFINERIYYPGLAENIDQYNVTHLRGYMILGGNGEFLGLTEAESLEIVKTVIKRKSKDKTAIVGTSRESAYSTLEFIKKAADFGADFASVITPFYYAKLMNDEALVRYYFEIADESPIPLIIYNSPEYAAGVRISPNVVSTLSEHENIVAMKNSADESFANYVNAIHSDRQFYIHVGRVPRLGEGLSAGAIGATLAIANYLPEMCCDAFSAFQIGDMLNLERLLEKLTRISKTISPFSVPGVKYAMEEMGLYGGETRLPLLPLSAEQKSSIKTIING